MNADRIDISKDYTVAGLALANLAKACEGQRSSMYYSNREEHLAIAAQNVLADAARERVQSP